MTAQNVNLIYKDTKANIEAQSNFEGFLSYATDTNQLGFYNGTSWVWFTFSNMQDEILAAPQKYPMEIVDLVPILDGSDGNSLKYVLSTTLLTFVQNTLRSVGTIQPATTALNDFVTGNGSGYWVKKTLAETITILRGSLDSVYAATAKGVTNGDSHDHNGGDGAQIAYSSLSGTPTIREVLTGNRTYYVRTDGNDSNNGLANTSGGAFLTIQKAINVVAGIDLSIYDVTIQVADGTYSNTITVNGPWVGSGNVTLIGNTSTPANVLINPSGNCITVQNGGRLIVKGMKVTSSGGTCLAATGGGYINCWDGMSYGTAGYAHMYAASSGRIAISASYSIVGSAVIHYDAESTGYIQSGGGITATLTGTPAFSGAFAIATRSGVIECYCTFSGSATGSRYSATILGNIFVNGAGANYFPGNSAGGTSTGGQYN